MVGIWVGGFIMADEFGLGKGNRACIPLCDNAMGVPGGGGLRLKGMEYIN